MIYSALPKILPFILAFDPVGSVIVLPQELHVFICHCTDCQAMSGSAYRTIVPARRGTFYLLAGEPKIYVKSADSGSRRLQAFCPDCGSSLYSTPDEDQPEIYALRAPILDKRDELPPRKQIWTRSAQHWSSDLGALESFAEQF